MFRTEINPEASIVKINLQNKILTVGSCFSDSMGELLAKNKFDVLVNPFGTNYNPYSIHKSLLHALGHTLPSNTGYIAHEGIYAHYDFHSEFSALQKEQVTSKIQSAIQTTHDYLQKANWIFITYGTSWVYERNDSGEIVTNCHKVPQHNFKKELLSQKKILKSFEEFYEKLKSINPPCRLVLTVSPVRHVKDTLQHNSLSKAILRVTCHTIAETYPNVFYFPAYEIMMDDLRDYRFYKADMIHPSTEAENYIWKKFSESYFEESTKKFIQQWEPLLVALQHRAFHPDSIAHQNFLKKTLEQLERLSGTVNVDREINDVKKQSH
jgi:hypothetical protein